MLGGVVVGWGVAMGLQKVIASVVAIHLRHDLPILLILTASLVGIGLIASLLPAKKAASVEPMEALRTE